MIQVRREQDELRACARIFAGQHTNRVIRVARSVLGIDLQRKHCAVVELSETVRSVLRNSNNAEVATQRLFCIGNMRIYGPPFAQIPLQSIGVQRRIFAQNCFSAGDICAP